MIEVENDYISVTYEQPSQIYENHFELPLNYHTRPKSINIPIEQIVNELTTSQQPEKGQTPCSSTNQYLPEYTKKNTKRKKLDNHLSLRKSKM